jgi:hypothetical protein
LGGPVYNHPYGLVWVDVDGPSVYAVIKELADESDVDKALPPTLTICSGKEGRERKLYRLDREKHKHFVLTSTPGTQKEAKKNSRFVETAPGCVDGFAPRD